MTEILNNDQHHILESIAVHNVGNTLSEQGLVLSPAVLETDDKTTEILATYFLSPFTQGEYFNFVHDVDLNMNEVYSYVTRIFEDPNALYEQSVNLAKHLYQKSTHPKVKAGEFYVVLFRNCILGSGTVDAVGLFKSENKDTFLRIKTRASGIEVSSEKGVNINKLDKGCLIYNSDSEAGYAVQVVDNTNRGAGAEARYWVDDFLHLHVRRDEYYNTQNVMNMCKNFVTRELPTQFEVSKADQADFLNKSVKFFKENDDFNFDRFTAEVIEQPEVIDSFNQYKETFAQERDLQIEDTFAISDSAVKKQARVLKSVIKLDKNFHIYVHGNKQYIQKGYDAESGMHYYQLFFKEEQ